jgi:hypothetical protein
MNSLLLTLDVLTLQLCIEIALCENIVEAAPASCAKQAVTRPLTSGVDGQLTAEATLEASLAY